MKKWVCTVCGYVYEGENPPEACPVCKVPASKFKLQEEEMTWACQHEIGVGKAEGVSEDIIKDLRANFEGECSEVGMYLELIVFRLLINLFSIGLILYYKRRDGQLQRML